RARWRFFSPVISVDLGRADIVLTKAQLLEPLARHRTAAVVVTCMGVTRPWGRISASELDFASADSAMGHTADLALGIALAQPERKVICLNGDGSMLMTLGTLATIVDARAGNLVLFVLQNEAYEITGNQPIPGAGQLDFTAIARGAGFRRVYFFDDPAHYTAHLPEVLRGEGPVFVAVRLEQGSEGPISRRAREQSPYLKVSLAESAHRLRDALIRPPGA
ncbi:MAG: thiamine pyrophosphate-dependent enzyme, partial [Acidobacteriota bacterium]